jgi:hypothetical protein
VIRLTSQLDYTDQLIKRSTGILGDFKMSACARILSNERIRLDDESLKRILRRYRSDSALWKLSPGVIQSELEELARATSRRFDEILGTYELLGSGLIPTLMISPTKGKPDSKVTVRGKGFVTTGGSVVITFDGAVMSMDQGSLAIGPTGDFVAVVTIPKRASAGTHTMTVSDPSNNTASATFTVPAVAGLSTSTLVLVSEPTTVTLGVFKGIMVTYQNRASMEMTVIVLVVLKDSAGKIVRTSTGSIKLAPGGADSAFIPLSDVPPGSYTAIITVMATNGVTVSPTSTVTVTV